MEKSTAVRNAQLDAMETTVGVSAILKLRSGARPTHCSDADSGTVVSTINLPSDWMAAASGGVKGLAGTWEDTAADNANAGGAMHWRLYASDGTTCHAQGTVTVTGGGGEIELQNLNITAGQDIKITAFNITAAGA
jgi:hypothetical protein